MGVIGNQISGVDDTNLDYLIRSNEEKVHSRTQLATHGMNDSHGKSNKNGNAAQADENSPTNSTTGVPGGPTLRLLRAHRSGNGLSIYFVNEGDEIKNIYVSSPQTASVKYSPKEVLKRNSSGWVTLNYSEGEVPPNPVIAIDCEFEGMQRKKEYFVDEENNKLLESGQAPSRSSQSN